MKPANAAVLKERLRALLMEAMPPQGDDDLWQEATRIFEQWLTHARALP